MQTQTQSRKRPAPGTSPQQPQQQLQQQAPQSTYQNYTGMGDASQLTDEQFMGWARGDGPYLAPDTSGNTGGYFANQQMAQPSNQLIRRNMNNQLAGRARSGSPTGQELWDFNSAVPTNWEELEDGADLEARAAAAKKEAQGKRPPKSIPPFIQKLSSFLDNNGNNDLIRWSEDGNSFIVLDEDGFAKTLIPELFKHDKYTSFVRQLNMYGFHKKVGLSDNSMRASEKKMRSPSEYYHPYFKRGRPELLWLIQKPKTEKKKPKKGEQDGDSGDEDQKPGETKAGDAETEQNSNTDLAAAPKTKLSQLEQEVRQLQKSQQQITAMLQRLRDENNQYIRQASTMVAQHERHENSINAILTFLASIYNSTLQGQDNLGTMFANAISQNQRSGNVMDMGDFDDSYSGNAIQRQKRPLALLPPPASDVKTEPASAQDSPQPQQSRLRPNTGQSSRLRSATPSDQSSGRPSPVEDGSVPNTDRNNDMMNVINNVNANTARTSNDPRADLNSALQSFQNVSGTGPLTPEQRDKMLSLMNSHSGANTPVNNNPNAPPSTTDNNPITFLDHFQANREQLDMLQRLQQEQDSRMQDLADRLQPLSPNGYIPGLALQNSNTNQQPADYDPSQFNSDFDLDNFINNDYFPPSAAYDAAGGNSADFNTGDINFDDFDGTAGGGFGNEDNAALFGGNDAAGEEDGFGDGEGVDGASAPAEGKVLGSVAGSSAGQSPSPKIEEVDDDGDDAEDVQSPPKKRRTTRQSVR